MNTKPIVVLRLYRNLLRAAKPFTSPSPQARVLNCLLSRTGIDDHIHDWETFVSTPSRRDEDPNKINDLARNLSTSYATKKRTTVEEGGSSHQTAPRLFRRLLREVVCGGNLNSFMKVNWPSQVDPTLLWNIIRREFRDTESSQSRHFSIMTRRQVAFMTLRELSKKLCYFDFLDTNSPDVLPQQRAWNVSPVPFYPSSAYLKPGVFLLSHPSNADSYFRKTAVCILEHDGESQRRSDDEPVERRVLNFPGQQTYGLIVNRPSIKSDTGKQRTLREAFDKNMLPGKLADVFGDFIVRDGGPIHVSLQMVHSRPATSEEGGSLDNPIGGRPIPMVTDDEESSPALYSDRATYFQGEIFKAMVEIEKGNLDRDDIAFFVGATTWSVNQLSNEVAQGYWIPCRGPPEMVLTGMCEHDLLSSEGNRRPLADLWLSMMSACGDDEAKLAHLFYNVGGEVNDNGLPCDAFEGEETDVDC